MSSLAHDITNCRAALEMCADILTPARLRALAAELRRLADRAARLEQGGTMALSDNIEALAGTLEKYRDTGANMEPLAIREICAVLSACAEDARRLEAMIWPARDLPADVIDLVALRRGASAPAPLGGGDAA